MKNFLLTVIVFISFQFVYAQETNELLDDKPYSLSGIDVKPEFPGGMNAFYSFISSNYNVTDSKDFPGGKVFVNFIIEKDGEVSEIKVLRDVGFGTGEEAIRVLKKCPKWIPGEQNGKFVRCSYALPIVLPAYIYEVKEVDVPPNYIGGFERISSIISENFLQPVSKEFKGGDVLISFIVESDGTISNTQIYKDLGFGTGEEALRVLKGIKNWIPAKKNKKNVRCNFGIPIKLKSN